MTGGAVDGALFDLIEDVEVVSVDRTLEVPPAPGLPAGGLIALDLFAGMGWGVAARALEIHEFGVEIMPEAVESRTAAGFDTLYRDVWEGLDGSAVVPAHDLLIASPPCQTFSVAGKGSGRQALDEVLTLIREGAYARPADMRAFGAAHDDRTALVLTPLAYVHRWMPRYVALEQVPAVLPVWEAYAAVMRAWGYSVATGILTAEQYGVPQTRKRAILVARRDGVEAQLPRPTHSRYYSQSPERLDEGVLPWVSMAEALGWGPGLVGFPRRDDGRAGGSVEIGGVAYRGRDLRSTDEPAQTVTEKARSWLRFMGAGPAGGSGRHASRDLAEPAQTITGKGTAQWVAEGATRDEIRAAVAALVEPRVNNQSGTAFDLAWPLERPAPTIAGRDLVTMPGANANRFNGATKSRNDGIRVSVAEAAVLQSFPADFPFQGPKTSQFLQVGNAVPPGLAAAVLETFLP